MFCRRGLANPMRATIARCEYDAGFAKYPTALSVSKHGADQSRINIGSIKVHAPPTETTVLGFQQICSGLVIRFQFEKIALGYYPSNLFVGEVNVAQVVFGERQEFPPRLSAVSCLKQSAATAGDPTSILVEKVNCVQPGHRA